jgi:hypothetical protein
MEIPEYELEHLLAYDGRRHDLESGHFLKFVVRTVEKSNEVPHGIAYSFTLHTPDGERLLGFDNAHTVPHPGSKFVQRPAAADHWHRTENDPGRPYQFTSALQLLDDYFDAVEKKLIELDVPFTVVPESEEE